MTATTLSPREATSTAIGRALRNGETYRRLGPLTGLIVALVVFSLLSPAFVTAQNFSLILQQAMEVGTIAIGQTIIFLTRERDLSNGGIMLLSSLIMATLATHGMPVAVAIAIGFLVGIVVSALNGFLVTYLNLSSFIITLGTLSVTTAMALIYTKSQAVIHLPASLTFLGTPLHLGDTTVMLGAVVMVVLMLLMSYVLTQTSWGRHIYVVGGSRDAARLGGINVRHLQVSVFAVAGVFYAITALMVLGRTSVGDPLAGATDNLDSITAVVVGGTSAAGGRGGVLRTLVGALIVTVIANGLTVVGVDALYQQVATGVLVIVAVALDRLSRRSD